MVAALLPACSVNVGKLRAPKASPSDAAVESVVEPDAPLPDTAGDGEQAPADLPEVLRADVLDTTRDTPPEVVTLPSDARDAKPGPDLAGPDRLLPDAAEDANDDPDGTPDTSDGTSDSSGDGDSGTGGAGGADGHTGGDGSTGTDGAVIDPDLVLWYRFDESSGTVANDSAAFGPGAHDGKVKVAGNGGSATFTTDCQVGSHAINLSPSRTFSGGGYVEIPALKDLAPGAITVALWVRLTDTSSDEDWERIFDFGTGTTPTAPFFYLTARASDVPGKPLRFGISRSGNTEAAEQRLQTTSGLTKGVWHHIAIVLPPATGSGPGQSYTGIMYVDGQVAATNNYMTLHLSDLAPTTNNYLGRSQFDDPLFNGSLDDFRVYRRALSQAEISVLYALR